jgi:pimeloyl-ACP methyl ester carboxylesterase
MVRTPHHVLESAMRNLWVDHTAAARAVSVPALAVYVLPSLMNYDALAQLVPGLQRGATVGAGHFLQLEVPQQFNAMLRTFIDQLQVKP